MPDPITTSPQGFDPQTAVEASSSSNPQDLWNQLGSQDMATPAPQPEQKGFWGTVGEAIKHPVKALTRFSQQLPQDDAAATLEQVSRPSPQEEAKQTIQNVQNVFPSAVSAAQHFQNIGTTMENLQGKGVGAAMAALPHAIGEAAAGNWDLDKPIISQIAGLAAGGAVGGAISKGLEAAPAITNFFEQPGFFRAVGSIAGSALRGAAEMAGFTTGATAVGEGRLPTGGELGESAVSGGALGGGLATVAKVASPLARFLDDSSAGLIKNMFKLDPADYRKYLRGAVRTGEFDDPMKPFKDIMHEGVVSMQGEDQTYANTIGAIGKYETKLNSLLTSEKFSDAKVDIGRTMSNLTKYFSSKLADTNYTASQVDAAGKEVLEKVQTQLALNGVRGGATDLATANKIKQSFGGSWTHDITDSTAGMKNQARQLIYTDLLQQINEQTGGLSQEINKHLSILNTARNGIENKFMQTMRNNGERVVTNIAAAMGIGTGNAPLEAYTLARTALRFPQVRATAAQSMSKLASLFESLSKIQDPFIAQQKVLDHVNENPVEGIMVRHALQSNPEASAQDIAQQFRDAANNVKNPGFYKRFVEGEASTGETIRQAKQFGVYTPGMTEQEAARALSQTAGLGEQTGLYALPKGGTMRTPEKLHQAGIEQKPGFDQNLSDISKDSQSQTNYADVKSIESIQRKLQEKGVTKIGESRMPGLTGDDVEGLGKSGAGTAEKSLLQEARKYKSAEEFRNALFPSGGAMDISNRNTQRLGRLISSSIKGEELPNAVDFAKNLDYEWKDIFKKAGEPIPNLSKGKITIYRAAPKGTSIEPGDWVAVTKDYANIHKGEFGRNAILKMEVSPKDIVNAGTDANEWFYAPENVRSRFGELYGDGKLESIWEQANSIK